jgi:hypothetical protein
MIRRASSQTDSLSAAHHAAVLRRPREGLDNEVGMVLTVSQSVHRLGNVDTYIVTDPRTGALYSKSHIPGIVNCSLEGQRRSGDDTYPHRLIMRNFSQSHFTLSYAEIPITMAKDSALLQLLTWHAAHRERGHIACMSG